MFKLKLSLFFLFFIFIFSPVVLAQQEFEDYQYQYEKYRGFYENYLKAKDTYLKYQTLNSQNEFIQASKDFLIARNLTLRTYFQFLKRLLRETTDIDSNLKVSLNLNLDQEINWFLENEKQLKDASVLNLTDLLELSVRLERKRDLFQKLTYQTLANSGLGKMRSLQTEVFAINFLLETEINQLERENKELLREWLEIVRNKSYEGQRAIQKAEEFLDLIDKTSQGEVAFNNYLKIIEELNKGRLLFLETIKFQEEILKEIEK